MTTALATIVMTPRERYSHALETLESIFENTSPPFELIVVDGNSPTPVREAFRSLSEQRNFTLLRSETFLTPNQARNLGWKHVKSKYVAFVDNDLIVTSGWLDELVNCAEKSGAWAVSPLYLEGPVKSGIVHMAGGEAMINTREGKRYCHSKHLHSQDKLADIQDTVKAAPTQLVEFHCVLCRTDLREKLGPFDEGLMSMCEHLDFCLQVKEAGGSLWLEPNSIVSYDISTRFKDYDLPFFETRWSEEWTEKTLTRFCSKWNLDKDDPYISRSYEWVKLHRRLAHASRVPWPLRVAAARTRKSLGKLKHAFQA